VTDDITMGGKPSNRPMLRLDRPCESPTVRIAAGQPTRQHEAPRAISIVEAQEIAADILSGSAGLMKVGRPGIEALAWLVVRLDPASVVDRADDMVTLEQDLDQPGTGE
jgi:hypothetical protein